MKKILIASIILIAVLLSFSGCGKTETFLESVCGKYTDGGINSLELKADGTYAAITNGKTVTGTWDTDGHSVTVKDGSEEYDGVPLALEYINESGAKTRFDAVTYLDGNNFRRIQLGVVVYISE